MDGRQHAGQLTDRSALAFGMLGLVMAWTLLWLQLNSDWTGLLGGAVSLSVLRALVPLGVGLIVGVVYLRSARAIGGIPWSSVDVRHPMILLAAFGLVGAFAALIRSPSRLLSLYWAANFLIPVGITWLITSDRTLLEGRDLFHVTLGIAFAIATGLLVFFSWRAGIFEALWKLDLYRVGTTYGDAPFQALLINANGTGRFAAVAVLLGLSFLLTRISWSSRLFAAVVIFAFGTLLTFTQSRGAILSFLAASAVLLGLHKGWKTSGLLVGGGVVGAGYVFRERMIAYFTRGFDWVNVATLTGRTDIWKSIWPHIVESPLIGWGFWADRLLINREAHSALMGSLITSGVLGTLLFLAAWGLIWWFVLREGLPSRFDWLGEVDRNAACLATAMLVFLTVRAIPESTGTFFGVDLLLLVPTLGFLYEVKRRRGADEPEAARSDADQPLVLTCAYACAPPGSASFNGGETLLGWRLTEQIADRSELTVLVSAEHRASIENAETDIDARFVAVDLPVILRPLRRFQGGIQLYAYLWQIKAYFVARRLHRESPFDLFHHITYANDWMASYIGAYLDVPYVRGPGGGAQQVPEGFDAGRSLRFRLAQTWRAGMQKFLRLDPVYRRSQDNADKLLVCTRESWRTFPERWREKTEMFPVNGIDPEAFPDSSETASEEFTVLSVGKLLEIKGFDLAIHSFADFADRQEEGRLLIVGDGPDRRRLEQFAADLGVEDRVEFLGWQPHDEVLQRMVDADVFLFASLRDGGGGVVVEAMAAGTPVVCLDHAGPGYHTRNGAGLAIEPSHPKLASLEMADALEDLHLDADLRDEIGERGKQRALSEYRWADHGDRIASIYREVLGYSPESVDLADREEDEADLSESHIDEVPETLEGAGGEPT